MAKVGGSFIPDIKDIADIHPAVNFLIYSDPGGGKTRLAATAPGVVILNAEGDGIISARKANRGAKVVDVPEYATIRSWLQWARNGGVAQGEWWCIDTLTRVQEMIRQDILERAGIESMRIQDYGTWADKFKGFVLACNALPCNMIYLCHTMSDEDEEGNKVVLPALNGKNGSSDPTNMSRWVAGTMTDYGYLRPLPIDKERPNEYKSRLILRRSGPYFAKSRHEEELGSVVNDPDFAKMATKMAPAE